MIKLTVNQERQLAQLSKHAPDIHRSVADELSTVHPMSGSKVTGRVIGDGMRLMAYQLSRPNPDTLPVAVPGQVLFDLVIASKKYGYNSTDHAEAPILWWKLAGQEKEELYPGRKINILDAAVQDRLQDYELVATEPKLNMIIRKYRRIDHVR